MGNYATYSELQSRCHDATEASYFTDTDSSGTPSTTILNECVDGAEGLIDSYLGQAPSRYVVPVVVATGARIASLLKQMTLDIAEYYLQKRTSVVPAAQIKAYDDAVAWAKEIANGDALLPDDPPTNSTEGASWSGSNREQSSTSPRIFTRETLAAL